MYGFFSYLRGNGVKMRRARMTPFCNSEVPSCYLAQLRDCHRFLIVLFSDIHGSPFFSLVDPFFAFSANKARMNLV